MEWIICMYKDGSNPYIIKTEKEKNKILKKYKNKIIIQNGLYNKIFIIDNT